MSKYFVLSFFLLSLSWQAFAEEPVAEPELQDNDFGDAQFNDTDGNIVPLPRYAQLNINDKTYTLFFQPVNWHAAVELCSSQNQNIASVTSSVENCKLRDILTQYRLAQSDRSFWLGASELAHSGQWSWINTGRPILYTNWRAGEPNNANDKEHCLELLSDGKWNDFDCDQSRYVMCESRPPCNNYYPSLY